MEQNNNINQSTLQSGSWYAEMQGMDGIIFKLTDFSIPEVTLGSQKLGNQSDYLAPIPGDKIKYDTLILDFLLDADLTNYRRVYDWLRSSVGKVRQPRDFLVYVLDGEKHLQNVTIQFKDCFPIRIRPFLLDSNNTKTFSGCSVELEYTLFDFV